MDNTLIRASAGTGKTFALSNRYLALLCGGAEVDEVLATTFTRKAAAQILDRVLVRLATAALDDAKCAELAQQIGVPGLTRTRALALTVTLLKNLDRLQVMTLDSFFAQVGSRFALEMGLPAGWTIASELEDAALRHEAIEEMLANGGDGPIVRLLRLMTKGEARRSVAQLIHDTVTELYGVLRQSGDQAWRKLPRPTPLSVDELAATIEQLKTAPLPDDGRFSNARERDVNVATDADWDELTGAGLIAKVLSGENTYYKKPIPAPTVAIYQKLIKHVRAIQLLKLADQTEATADMLLRFDEEYRQLKRRRRLSRFEDITESVGQATALTGAGGLAWRLESDVHHLLLDEFQDTSLPQWQAIRPLAKRVCQPGPAAGSLFSVGDVKQAIYGWRGGVAEIFDTLTEEVPSLAPRELNESYRSAQAVIDTVNLAFRPAMHQNHNNLDDLEPAVEEWCRRMPLHTTAKKGLAGYVALMTAPESLPEDDNRGVAALRYGAQRIAELKPRIGTRSIGVLVRRNETVARMIHELRKLNVDASEEGGNPLTDSAAVGTVLSLLRLADHPGDSVSAYHVAHSPLGPVVGLTDHTDMEAVCALARRVREELLTDGYAATVGRFSTGLAPSCDQRELARLRQLTEVASDYDRDATLRCDDFVTMIAETRRQQAAASAVRVMTIHQAKGLEFDAVVLPDLDYSMLGQPSSYVAGRSKPGEPIDRVCIYRSKDFRPLLPPEFQGLFEESRRQETDEALSLLYVMLTRAAQGLYMIIQPDESDKQALRKNYASLLRASLAPAETAPPESTLYECGDPEWWGRGEGRGERAEVGESGTDISWVAGTGVEPPARRSPGKPLAIKLAPPVITARRAAAADSPSRLEGGPKRPAETLLRTDSAAARCRGRLMHAWFEQVDWLDAQETDSADYVTPGRRDLLSDEALTKIARRLAVEGGREGWPEIEASLPSLIAKFRKMLNRPEIQEALSRTAYQSFQQRYLPRDIVTELEAGELDLVLKRECLIAARHDGRLIGGQADRIVVMSRGGRRLAAEVIDFKTDRFDAEDLKALKAKVDFYRPQLAAYCDAVAQMYRLQRQRVCARLVFVESGVVAEV